MTVDFIRCPGASRSRFLARFVFGHIVSSSFAAPTEVALGRHAGEEIPVVNAEFPDAAATVMFFATALLMAAAVAGSSALQSASLSNLPDPRLSVIAAIL